MQEQESGKEEVKEDVPQKSGKLSAARSEQIAVLKQAFLLYSRNDMDVYAGHATVCILTAVFPCLMLIIAVVNLLPGNLTGNLINLILSLLPDLDSIRNFIVGLLENLQAQTSSLLASASALIALWSASGGVSAVQKGMKKISVNAGSSFLDKPKALLYTVLFIIMIPALLIFQVLGNSLQEIVRDTAKLFGFASVITDAVMYIIEVSGIVTVVLAFLFILLIYRFLPGGSRSFREQIPGTAAAAVGWILFSQLFSFFIQRFWHASGIYGSLATLFLIILWMRIIFAILFLGAALNTVLKEHAQINHLSAKK